MHGHLTAELQITGAQRDRLEGGGGPTAVSGAPPSSLSQPAAGTAPWGLSGQSHMTFPHPGASSPRSRSWQGWSQPESSPRRIAVTFLLQPHVTLLCACGGERQRVRQRKKEIGTETQRQRYRDRQKHGGTESETGTWRDREIQSQKERDTERDRDRG